MIKFFMMVVLVALVASPAMADTIVGSKHDMIASGFATESNGGTEVCIFCHTPHNAQAEPLVPLWNNTSNASASGFYTSPTTNFQSDQDMINATDARICLACHDGTVSDPVNGPNGGATITIEATAMSPDAILGLVMSNDHPIGMDVGGSPETGLSGPSSLKTMATIKTNFGNENPFFGGVDALDNINIMYCSSCHDVHDGDPLMKPFLRIDNTGSALCKACHKR